MKKLTSGLAVGALLTVGLCLPVAAEDERKQIAAAQQDFLELVEALEKGASGAARAKAIRKKYDDFSIIAAVYKPTAKGGIGYPPKGTGDGIELKIINLGKRVLSPAELKAHKDRLLRLGHINLAMSEVAHRYAPTNPKFAEALRQWRAGENEMRKASKDLIEAVRKGDGGKLKAAAATSIPVAIPATPATTAAGKAVGARGAGTTKDKASCRGRKRDIPLTGGQAFPSRRGRGGGRTQRD